MYALNDHTPSSPDDAHTAQQLREDLLSHATSGSVYTERQLLDAYTERFGFILSAPELGGSALIVPGSEGR